MPKTKAQIIAEAQVVKNATEVGENTATRVGGVLVDLADADSVVIIPVTGTSSSGNITLSFNPFTQVQTAVNAGQHAIVRVTVGNDVVDFSMNTYSDSVSTYIGASKAFQQEFQMTCTASGTVIETINTSNTFSTGESVPNVGIDDVPTQGSANLVKSGGVWEEISQLDINVNGVDYTTADADVHQVNTSSTVETTSGTRLRLLFYVYPGAIVSASCPLGSGLAAVVYSTKDYAVIAGNSGLLQSLSSSYIHSLQNVVISKEGYLTISLKKSNGSSFTAQEKEQYLAETVVSITKAGLVEDVDALREKFSTFSWNNSIIGNGNEYVAKNIVGFVPGRKYLLVLKNTTWDMDGVTSQDAYKWKIDSFYNGSSNKNFGYAYVGVSHTTVEQQYILDIPSNSDFVRIGIRAKKNEVIYFNIFDITYAITYADSLVVPIKTDIDNIETDIGEYYDKNSAKIIRAVTSSSSLADNPNGTRIRCILPVRVGMTYSIYSTDSGGFAAGVYDTENNAALASSSQGLIQSISSGYAHSKITGQINADGYLCISLTNGNTAISDSRKQEMIDSLSFSCGLGIEYKVNTPPDIIMDDVTDAFEQPLSLYTTPPFMKGVNHRGYSVGAPENTLPAFVLSYRHGFRYVETDIAFTADGVPVLLHDSTIDRTSDGTGNINDLTYQQVLQYDFGSWFSSDYAGTKIPTLMEALALFRNLGLHPWLEIKNSATYTTEQIHEIVDLVESYGMKGNVTYLSFNSSYLRKVVSYDETANVSYVVYSVSDAVITTANSLRTGRNKVSIGSNSYTAAEIEKCKSAHFPLGVWTIESAQTIASLDPYISSVTSNSQNAMLIKMTNELS